ncbi:MAG: hypothetical protein KC486_36360, partial [Myxococcales bacterium]|nr:hypothetical protein [Myxococcales bacterium]
MSVVSAPGKALLIGEYAVLEGATALVTAIDVRAIARAPKGPRREPTAVVQAAFDAAADFVRGRGLAAPTAPPVVDTGRFSRGIRKLGLGSSAAVAATVVGHVLAEAGLDLADPEVRQAAYELARAAHREAQGGGSGADVAASVLGGALRFRDGEATPVALPSWLKIAFVDAGAPASTASFVRQVKAAAVADPDTYDAAMKRLRGASDGFFAALERAEADDDDAARESFAALKDAVAAHNAGLRALQELSGAPILTATIDAILDLAGELGLAAKPSGAGGGDLVVVFARSQAALDHLADRLLRERGIQLLSGLSAGAQGLRREAFAPRCSRLAGFFRLHIDQRRAVLAEACAIDPADFEVLDPGALALDQAEHMIENVVG